jgi:hypothetical protein
VAAGPVSAATAAATAAGAGSRGCVASATEQVREVGRYRVTFSAGRVPPMYTVAQARSLKPLTGVVMLEPMRDVAGGMTGAGAGRFHLRVQVCDRVTGRPLRSPRPKVTIAVSMLRQSFPLTLGYDLGGSPADVRFCQNIVLPAEQIGVSVQVGGEVAPFTVALG